ncbi:PhzF family phenazine biosynthesis protein [Microbacterium resistens]|uniref:PhzF family phenazine biosynthesis protein n=1 Tax=Microbacterium resistens TaxID=156977 RepID=A0ABU1S8P3_9MICO|nr:PhzF family phenazine biosynthesis protein [Microbacterium resistens]MDR6865920.1 PhzF family phenazine biosynthesis protein [Microbacterium resistens]
MTRRFRQVDVFGEQAMAGNPVAVVLDAEGIGDEEMRKFSVWSNLSECTFVLPPSEPGADYRVRIFSLSVELPFAGHPTLGTARAWLDAGGVPATPGTIVQECAAGLIPVRIDGELLSFRAPQRIRSGAVDPELLAAVVSILGADPGAVVDAEWLDNGPGWIGVLLDRAETVLGLRPDSSRHPGRWDIGVIGAHGQESETDFELRAFFTDGDSALREDPVTGSLNAAAAQWLVETERATLPYTASQGGAMGRNGRIHLSGNEGSIWVGGRTDVVLAGTADLLPAGLLPVERLGGSVERGAGS